MKSELLPVLFSLFCFLVLFSSYCVPSTPQYKIGLLEKTTTDYVKANLLDQL